jgi:quercetin dioxygenase-like cupin family protein
MTLKRPKAGAKNMQHDILPITLTEELLLAIPPKPLPKKRGALLRADILARVARAEANNAASVHEKDAITTVFSASCDWQPLLPNVERQYLFRDNKIETFLVRMAPGSSIPAHDHPEDEECFVVDGSYEYEGMVVQRGDFQFSRGGSRHAHLTSSQGCTLLIRRAVHQASAAA